jgi:hypothetical protein
MVPWHLQLSGEGEEQALLSEEGGATGENLSKKYILP